MSAAASTPLVRVEMTEFRFRPSIIRLSAGTPATIELVNVGQIAHQLDAPFLRHVPVTVADNSTHIEAPGLNLLRVQPAARTRG